MQPGDQYKAYMGFQRLDDAEAKNKAAGAHLWITQVIYGLTDEEAARTGEGVSVLLDPPHLLAITPIGCFICEQPYDSVVGTPCKGEPA